MSNPWFWRWAPVEVRGEEPGRGGGGVATLTPSSSSTVPAGTRVALVELVQDVPTGRVYDSTSGKLVERKAPPVVVQRRRP